jgi:hypothetical protein
MDPNTQAPLASDARLAGGLMSVVQQLQKNRFGGIRELQGSPIGAEAKGSAVLSALNKNKQQNEQEQNAAPASGALQETRSQEQGRQRDVGQREAQGRPGQSQRV